MPQNFFEPRTPVGRPRPPGLAPGLAPAPRESASTPAFGSPSRSEGPEAYEESAGPEASEGSEASERTAPPPEEPLPHSSHSSHPSHSSRPPRSPEPSWARIYWNTLRSFTRRSLGLKPLAAPGHQGSGRRRGRLLFAAVLVLAVFAAGAMVGLRGHDGSGTRGRRSDGPTATGGSSTSTPAGSSGGRTPPPVRDAAASWVAGHIGADHVVACDAAVCAALASHGFPAGSTVAVHGSAQDVLGADVAVVTGPLRALAGAALTDVTGSEPLAVFGAGAQRAEVLPVAHAGRTAYDRTAAADRADRRFAGTSLAGNKKITFRGGIRSLLTGGDVDLRVCALLAVLSSGHTLSVESFAPPAPGAGPDIARSAVEISRVDGASAADGGPHAAALRALIAAQQPPYRPMRTVTRPGRAGSPAVLSVLYDQPAPDGLDSNPTP
jgi:hypothetical protein